jgi:hypothetical protein
MLGGSAPWRIGAPFIAPRGLGAVGASFGSSQPSSVRECTGLSGAHQTTLVQQLPNSLIGCLPFWESIVLFDDPPSHWSLLTWLSSRWPPGTPNCLVLCPDPVISSRRGPAKVEAHKFGRTGAGLSSVAQTSPLSSLCVKLLWLLLARLERFPNT